MPRGFRRTVFRLRSAIEATCSFAAAVSAPAPDRTNLGGHLLGERVTVSESFAMSSRKVAEIVAQVVLGARRSAGNLSFARSNSWPSLLEVPPAPKASSSEAHLNSPRFAWFGATTSWSRQGSLRHSFAAVLTDKRPLARINASCGAARSGPRSEMKGRHAEPLLGRLRRSPASRGRACRRRCPCSRPSRADVASSAIVGVVSITICAPCGSPAGRPRAASRNRRP